MILMKEQVFKFLKQEYPNLDFDVFYPPEGLGDYSTNIAFILAKQIRGANLSPERLDKPDVLGPNIKKIVEEVIGKLKKEFSKEFEKIEVAKNGFINFYLEPSFLQQQLKSIYKNKRNWGRGNLGRKQTVIIEYSQPNIAKVMHVGHMRSTFIGDTLANTYKYLGYKVIRWNYLGDWGTQFGNLIAAYKLWGDREKVEKNPIETLNKLYVKFHDEMKNNPELGEKGRQEFKKLEEGDKKNRILWEWFRIESIKEFNKIYQILEVKFDTIISESFFEKDLKPLVSELLDKGIAKKSEGAIIIDLEKFNLSPALIQKSDATSLYLTRDIANLKYRISKYKPSKILYVVGNEQSLHFQQLLAISKILNLDKTKLDHVKFGLVLGEDRKKLSSREGKAIHMMELVKEAIEKSRKKIEESNKEYSEVQKEEIPKVVGIGGLKYFVLKEHRNSDIVFNWDEILKPIGNTGPYLQYTYARLKSIMRKSKWFPPLRLRSFRWYIMPNWIGRRFAKINISELKSEQELRIIKQLLDFPDIISNSAKLYSTNNLALYLYELSSRANHYYETVEKLSDYSKRPERNARLLLVETIAAVLKNGLNLLGIEAPERI
ncbi:MAG: arginyl-tRNA synthetase [Parcubacteria group bacterium Gr01-1014_2]|nr:MAG: arginyl-tRNA synthetase [Parcubacteria group bacterium Gr01-1014_2]